MQERDVRVNLMIEGQEDVSWPQWRALADAVQAAGLEGLFRSDHYQSVASRTERGSLDAWATIAGLAALSSRIRLGTLVSPTSFRHPSVLAKSVVTADHISGGRVELGMGAGWHALEHTTYGFPFPDLGRRFELFEEQVEIVVRQLTEERFDHRGRHYTLEGCEARPKAAQAPRPPLLIGGVAGPRSVRLAARWADEYNTVFPSVEAVAARKARVDAACAEVDRAPLTFSMMTGCILGRDEAEFRDRAALLQERSGRPGTLDQWLDGLRDAWILGTPDQAATRLTAYRDAGLDRVMLQHQLHDDLEMVALMGQLAAALR